MTKIPVNAKYLEDRECFINLLDKAWRNSDSPEIHLFYKNILSPDKELLYHESVLLITRTDVKWSIDITNDSSATVLKKISEKIIEIS